MYKIVCVAGKYRGHEFSLEEGETLIGRSSEAAVSLDILGLSKEHAKITVEGEKIFLEDLRSSNGSFINGKIITSSPLKKGDKIAFPEIIFQLVYVKEKFVQSEEGDENEDFMAPTSSPKNLIERGVHIFKYKVMPHIHRFNFEYEWRSLVAIFTCIFVFATIALTIRPVLKDSKRLIMQEFLKRGIHYTEEVARMNARVLERNNIDGVNTNFLDNEQGVDSYVLFDVEGRIVRPAQRLNSYINESFSVEAKEFLLSGQGGQSQSFFKKLDDGSIGIARVISAYNPRISDQVPVGVIAIRFSPQSLMDEATRNSKAYLEALVTAGIVAIIFFGIIYFLSVRPLDELKFLLEQSLRGKAKNVDGNFKMQELAGLKSSVNSLVQRNRELTGAGEEDEFMDLEEDSSYVEIYKNVLAGFPGPGIVLDSDKKVQGINTEAEDVTGIRESSAIDVEIIDVCREQGLAGTLIELCDMSAGNDGSGQNGEYELSGTNYEISVSSLIGKDNFAKSYLISFKRDL